MIIDAFGGWPLTMVPIASVVHYFFGITMSITAVLLILLVLVQRGRGGGLAGAFGGMGGQSAFGTKAGDTFTKVTIGLSIFWILLCIASVKLMGTSAGSFGSATAPEQSQFVPGATGGQLPDTPLPEGDQGTNFDPLGSAAPESSPAIDPPVDSGVADGSEDSGGQ